VLSRAYAEEICEVGRAAGLDRVGVAGAEPFVDARAALDERKAAGLAGSMQFTYRNPGRSTEPDRALAGVAALVVGARRYDREVLDPPAGLGVPARVARYAAGDHYGELRRGLDVVAERLVADGWSARVVLDDNALVDRAAAHRAALGWFGKNANILVPGLGSWVVLGSVLTTAPLPPAQEVVADGCGPCRRCLDGCPTGAIVEPGVVDARRCLAWLVQAEGVFPDAHRVALGDRLYGCDDCQEVCPPSRRSGWSPLPDEPVPDELVPAPAESWVDALDVLAADDAALLARFGRWYIPGREPRYLRRNALIVLGNTASARAPAVRRAVAGALAGGDALVAAHAVWAARRLGADDLVAAAVADGSLDAHDPQVRAELDRGVAVRVHA
jgi:epoxyqueuosine reductase